MTLFETMYNDGIKLKDLMDTFLSNNEKLCLWYIDNEDIQDNTDSDSEVPTNILFIFQGIGYEIPDEYLELTVDRIFGSVPEEICDADIINLLMRVNRNEFPPNLPRKEKMSSNEKEIQS